MVYPYALYDETHGDLVLDSMALRTELVGLHIGPREPQEVDDLLKEVQKVESDLQQRKDDLAQLSKPNPIDNVFILASLQSPRRLNSVDEDRAPRKTALESVPR